MKKRFLPYGEQCIDADDVAAVTEVLKSAWLTTGPAVHAFETNFATAVDAPHAVACSSGTAGLHLAVTAAKMGPGDTAIVPAVTFLATANAVRYTGAEVVFADVDPDTGLMRPLDLEAAYARAQGPVKVVLPVHLAGQMQSPEQIQSIAAAHGSIVIEDACHALGTAYTSKNENFKVGACRHSDMAVFSFHPVKTIAMGEGGAVTTRDATLAERLKRLCSHGMHKVPNLFENEDLAFDADGSPNPWYYEISEIGFNYRASDIHCALGLSQLQKLDRFVAKRRALAARYDALLKPLANLLRPVGRIPQSTVAWHLYIALIDFAVVGRTRAAVMRELHHRGIGTQVHYIPVPWQPYYRHRYGDLAFPGAQQYYERCLSLPLSAAMTETDVTRVVEGLSAVLQPA